jgi:hypothetical protein
MDDDAKRFTLEEANALLPTLVPLLEALREAHREIGERHELLSAAARFNGGGPPGRELLEASQTARRCLAEAAGLGVEVRDPATGLIDFPAERAGEIVFLCWRLGEDVVAWWHPTDTGFAGRQPI